MFSLSGSFRHRFTLHGLLSLHSFMREKGCPEGGEHAFSKRELDARLWGEIKACTARRRTRILLEFLSNEGLIKLGKMEPGRVSLSFTQKGLDAARGGDEFVFQPESFSFEDFMRLDPAVQRRIMSMAGIEGRTSRLGDDAKSRICAFMRLKLGNHALSVLSALSMMAIRSHAQELSINPKGRDGKLGLPEITAPEGTVFDSRGSSSPLEQWRGFVAWLREETGLRSTQIREGLDMLSRLGIIEEIRSRSKNLSRMAYTTVVRLTKAAIGWLWQIPYNAKRIASYVAGAIRRIMACASSRPPAGKQGGTTIAAAAPPSYTAAKAAGAGLYQAAAWD